MQKVAETTYNTLKEKAEALEAVKVAAIAELDTFYQNIDKSKYSQETYTSITRIYNEGKEAINAQTTVEGVYAKLGEVKLAINAFSPKSSGGDNSNILIGSIIIGSSVAAVVVIMVVTLVIIKKRKNKVK